MCVGGAETWREREEELGEHGRRSGWDDALKEKESTVGSSGV